MSKTKWIAISLLCIAIVLLLIFRCTRTIGTVLGPEREYIVIGEDHYIVSSDYHNSDRGLFLGLADDGHGSPSKVYQIQNVSQKEYLYVMDGWEGQCYVHIPPEDLDSRIPCPCPLHS